MRWFDPVDCSNAVANPLVTGLEDLGGIDPWRLRRGERIDRWPETAWLRPDSPDNDGDPDDVLQVHFHGVPVYSPRLRSALEAAGIRGIQYLPLSLQHYDGTPIPGYAVANILNVVPALDLEHSHVSRYGDDRRDRKGQIRSVNKAVLRKKILADHDVIRLEGFRIYICVSERFREVFQRGRFTGYSFRELEVV